MNILKAGHVFSFRGLFAGLKALIARPAIRRGKNFAPKKILGVSPIRQIRLHFPPTSPLIVCHFVDCFQISLGGGWQHSDCGTSPRIASTRQSGVYMVPQLCQTALHHLHHYTTALATGAQCPCSRTSSPGQAPTHQATHQNTNRQRRVL